MSQQKTQVANAARRLHRLMLKNDIPHSVISDLSGVDLHLFQKWAKGNYSGSTQLCTLAKVAKALGYTTTIIVTPRND